MLRNKKSTKLVVVGSLVSHKTVTVAVEEAGRRLRVALALESSMLTIEATNNSGRERANGEIKKTK
jgi:hypothetical protein